MPSRSHSSSQTLSLLSLATRAQLGVPGYAPGQEYILMDARSAIPKPESISLVEAATLGVGMKPHVWGYLKSCGYDVSASCSTTSATLVRDLRAVLFDYKTSLEQQVKEVLKITAGKAIRVFDAVAADDRLLAEELFRAAKETEKLFVTTNDWSGIGDFEALGPLGRPEAEELNKNIERFIPVIGELVATGKLQPADMKSLGKADSKMPSRVSESQIAAVWCCRESECRRQDSGPIADIDLDRPPCRFPDTYKPVSCSRADNVGQ
ncbi:hypothetical protein EDD37DRAFT_605922 [Exophiala viscosa]|uniref:Uncharacterized protein n=1 Tax=Exophiala viscosa TaxID=2486360 RepID=A0AAN6E4J7_9EURO|nr:hypothetical protein EDD36DRAFT_479916 [Exophiala viscosa]KAI1627095.1 hypothetical protein EDD37DRAFT_605922 [Exophiala viscosa]